MGEEVRRLEDQGWWLEIQGFSGQVDGGEEDDLSRVEGADQRKDNSPAVRKEEVRYWTWRALQARQKEFQHWESA